MFKVINSQSTGKTRKLLAYAKEHSCIVVCAMPNRMRDKAIQYGLGYVECISYEDFLSQYKSDELLHHRYVVDELDRLTAMMFQGEAIFDGYCLTTDA
jgi:hypothetical protein